jgi:hypothetical protein
MCISFAVDATRCLRQFGWRLAILPQDLGVKHFASVWEMLNNSLILHIKIYAILNLTQRH